MPRRLVRWVGRLMPRRPVRWAAALSAASAGAAGVAWANSGGDATTTPTVLGLPPWLLELAVDLAKTSPLFVIVVLVLLAGERRHDRVIDSLRSSINAATAMNAATQREFLRFAELLANQLDPDDLPADRARSLERYLDETRQAADLLRLTIDHHLGGPTS